jgi:hypothetical protein
MARENISLSELILSIQLFLLSPGGAFDTLHVHSLFAFHLFSVKYCKLTRDPIKIADHKGKPSAELLGVNILA